MEKDAINPETIETDSIIRPAIPSFRLPTGSGSRGALMIDNNGTIAFADSNLFQLLAIENNGFIGSDALQAAERILGPCFESPEAFLASWKMLLQNPDQVVDDVLQSAGMDGRVFHRYSAPVFGADGLCQGRVEIYSDITKRRELEAAVIRAYDELKTTRDQLVQSEKLRAIGEIASGVAHDFNNTLGIILGNLQMLLRSADDEVSRTRLESAQRAALDAADTVRRIQEFTRTHHEEIRATLDLNILAREVVEMMRPAWQDTAHANGRNVEIVLDLHENISVLGNAAEIREVLINILLNAVQAMPDGGLINISNGTSGMFGWICISDTGFGMADDVRQRVFDPFFTTRGVEGTGLGMSVAYGIIRRHGGNIKVDSEPGVGTSVTISLPLSDGTCAGDEEQPQLEVACSSPAKILVVDDEEMFAEVLVEMLSEFGHAVCAARSGSEAIEQFKENTFDLVLTDLGMPEMSGWQVASRIKDMQPETPVVLLTGWGTTLDEKDLETSRIDMVLSKPVKLEDLSIVVAEALGRKDSGI